MHEEIIWADYFAGAVPAGTIFDLTVQNLRGIASVSNSSQQNLNPGAELCLIGLVAYFEAFCKNHFASMVNICPELVENLQAANRDVSVKAVDLLNVAAPLSASLGFLIVDRFDFGTPKSVNSLYMDLIRQTPFSKEEAETYGKILDDRNLLVHHGGIFTPRYAKERFIERELGRSRLFIDSLLVTKEQFVVASTFVLEISRKMRVSTQSALRNFLRERRQGLSAERGKAVEALAWKDDLDETA